MGRYLGAGGVPRMGRYLGGGAVPRMGRYLGGGAAPHMGRYLGGGAVPHMGRYLGVGQYIMMIYLCLSLQVTCTDIRLLRGGKLYALCLGVSRFDC